MFSIYQVIKFYDVIVLGLKEPVGVTFLGSVGLEKGQDVLGHVADHSRRKLAIGAQFRKLLGLDQLVLEENLKPPLRSGLKLDLLKSLESPTSVH